MAAVPCHIRKAGLSAWLAELEARWDALRDRWLLATAPLNAVAEHYSGMLEGDPADCHGRAQAALDDASTWLAAGDGSVAQRVPLVRGLIDEVNCSAPPDVWDLAFRQAEAALGAFADWLYQRDQDLGSFEALWREIADGCPVPPGSPG